MMPSIRMLLFCMSHFIAACLFLSGFRECVQDSLTEWLDVVAALRIGTVENGSVWLRGELGGLEPHALRAVALAAGVEPRQSRGEGSSAEVAEDLVRLLAPEAGVVYVF